MVVGIDRPPPRDESRLFDDTRGFFRVRSKADIERALDALVVDGPALDGREADELMRHFVDILADGRPVDFDSTDTLEYAERNNLLLLFSPADTARFEALTPRLPEDFVEAWRAALRGGDPRDSFGPLTKAERLDEKRIEADVRAGRKLRRRRMALGVVVIAALVGAGLWWNGRDTDETASSGEIAFEAVVDRSGDLRAGPPPVVEKALVARLDRAVAVRAGAGDISDRIVLDPPAADLPLALGTVAATLFRYNGAGQVVLVGPPGWLAKACIQVSVMSATLRAFDTSYTETQPGACGTDRVFGRVANVGCVDPKQSVTMLDLVIPEGDVTLSEGGKSSVGAVRVSVVGTNAAYERDNVIGQITVAAGQAITVPTFGGAVGTNVSFDVSAPTGAPLVGGCTLR